MTTSRTSAGDAGIFTPAWRALLEQQTLRLAAAATDPPLQVVGWNLPGRPPDDVRATLLEEMAWALWASGADTVVWPLYVGVNPDEPPHVVRPTQAVREAVDASGGLGLRVGPGAAPDAGRVLQQSRAPIVLTGTAVEVRRSFCVSPWKQRLAGRLDAWGRAWDRRFTGPAAVRAIDTLRQCLRQALMAKQALLARRDEDLFLAARQSWDPKVPAPTLDVKLPEKDGRTRILMTMHWLELGGAEKGALDLIEHLPRDQYAIYVTTDVPSHHSWAARIRDRVEEIVHLPAFLDRGHAPVFFEHYLRTRKIDLMHIHHSGWAYEALPHIRRFNRELAVVDTLHILELPPSTGGYPELSCSTFEPFIDAHHVTSDYLQRFCRERWRVRADKLHRIYTNVDTAFFDPERVPAGSFRQAAGIAPDARLVVFLGRFVRQKRPERFVRMAAECRRRWLAAGRAAPEPVFALVGRGPHERQLRSLAASLGVADCLVFAGEADDPRQVYRDADVVVLPSENEGLAFVTFEAMAMATPIVCTDVAAQKELVPAAFRVPHSGDVGRALADAVVPLLLDPDHAREAGRQAREYILEHHRIQQTREAVTAMYERLLG